MDYKTILAVLHGEKDSDRVLDAALPLAQRFSAHLIGVHAEALPVPLATPLGFPDVEFIQSSADDADKRAAAMKAHFEARASREGQSVEWRSMQSLTGDSALSALQVAHAADLVVVQQSDPEETYARSPDNEALLFESGRPVLFVPYAMAVDTAFERILVAWNGTPEAARAAFDALPFIVKAKSTEILCVDPRTDASQDGVVSGADIAEALARHGARVTLSPVESAGVDAGNVIENHVAENGVGLLVMGAFSQSWLRQFFFGSATRTLLRSMPVATLMSR
ncbi:MAG TPA: universal stress protein [Rhizobiaceae bacterium]|nr:universal stress protein [Rhizobiaceae bacterium]